MNSGEAVELNLPPEVTREDVFTLYRARKAGCRIFVPIIARGGRKYVLDIEDLDALRTLGEQYPKQLMP